MSFLSLLTNPKTIAIIAISSFIGGWHAQTIYDGYIADKGKTKVIKKLGDGQNEIIKFNSAADKAIRASKDDKCLDSEIPKEVLNLLK